MTALKLKEVSLYAIPGLLLPLSDEEQLKRIIDYACRHYGVTMEELASKSRYQVFAFPRHLCAYAARKKTHLTLNYIGAQFKKDHSTLINGIKVIQNYIDTDSPKKKEIEDFMKNCLL